MLPRGPGAALTLDGRLPEALEHFHRAIAVRPGHGPHYLMRGECHCSLGQMGKALDDFRTALASGLDDAHADLVHRAVGRLLACEGRVEEAVAQYHASRAAAVGHKHEPRGVPAKVLETARLVGAYDALAEDVQNQYGKLEAALQVYRAKLDLQRRLAPSSPYDPSQVLLLPDDWVRNIGHMATIDALLKMKELGWRSWRSVVLLAPPRGTANRHYLNCLERRLTVVTDPGLCESFGPLAEAFGFRVAHALYTPGSGLLYFLQALGVIQQEWEAQGRPPLLTLSDFDRQRGRRVLQDLGLPADAWFVCLHVRDGGYHEAEGSRHQSHRNANALDYRAALREITGRGGWVVRMGDPRMKPLPATDGVIDYAHSPAKSDWMDVYLCGQCRFFLGLASGLSNVAFSFGAPCVYVNWISNVLPPFSTRDLFIPKLFRSEADGRLLSFGEMFDQEALNLNANYYLIGQKGLSFLDSDPLDIREVVREMLDQLDGRCVYSPEDLRLRGRLDAVLKEKGHQGYCRMGKAFLQKYRGLLSCLAEAAPRVAG